jgi:hypothetical protein
MTDEMRKLLEPLNVTCVDAYKIRAEFPVRILNGWELKAYAILHCPFEQVLLLDADNVPVTNPEFLFTTPEFRTTGAIFWPDFNFTKSERNTIIWRSCGVDVPDEREFESGQILIDKSRCWEALSLTMWLNENSDFYYHYIHGDKETFHLAFRKVNKPYSLVPTPIHGLDATMCQHDFEGRRIFQHRNLDKWNLAGNKRIPGFWFEDDCLEYLEQLRNVWRIDRQIDSAPSTPTIQCARETNLAAA